MTNLSTFGRLLGSSKPKLFIQGASDEFTSVPTLHYKVAKATGENKVVVEVDQVLLYLIKFSL